MDFFNQQDRETPLRPNSGNSFWKPWSFESINEIVWNPHESVGKPADAKRKKVEDTKKGKKLPKVELTPTSNLDTVSENNSEQAKYFRDNEIFILPRQFLELVLTWKRPSELLLNVSDPVDIAEPNSIGKVFIYSEEPYDLHKLNTHLESCSYFNHILDAFESLRLYGNFKKEDFDEFEFTEWKPSNYIYAMDKVVKGQPHKVRLNPYGKYIVRLYHCGKWREIQVDDRIPVAFGDKILLPCIYTENRHELWPLLITKAILKLNLPRLIDDGNYYLDQRSTHQCRMYDGSDCLCKDIKPIKRHYLLNESDIEHVNAIYLLTGWFPYDLTFSGKRSERVWDVFQKTFASFEYPKEFETTKKVKKKNSLSEVRVENKQDEPNSLITLDIKLGPNNVNKNKLYMEVNCSLVRSVPLEKTSKVPEPLALWKTYRWMYWAMEKNIWKPEDVNVFRSLLCSVPTDRHERFEHLFEQEWAKRNYKAKSGNGTDAEPQNSLKDRKTKATKKRRSETLDKQKSKESSPSRSSNSQVWIDYNKLIHSLECVKIYQKDNQYRRNIFISNEDEPTQDISKDKSADLTPKPSEKNVPVKQSSAPSTKMKDNKISTIRIYADEKTTLYLFVDQEEASEMVLDLVVLKSDRFMQDIKVKIEKYQWFCTKQQPFAEIATRSMKGLIIGLPEGRTVYRLKFQGKSFCFHIKTNSPNLQITDENGLFELMSVCSVRFQCYLQNILDCMMRYVESVGSKDFQENKFAFYRALLEYCKPLYGSVREIRKYMLEQINLNYFNMLGALEDYEGQRVMRRFIFMKDPRWANYPARITLGKQFLPVAIRFNSLSKTACDCVGQPPLFTVVQQEEIRQCAAIKIQSAMKMFYVKLLYRYHDPVGKNRKYWEDLKKRLSLCYKKYNNEENAKLENFLTYYLWSTTFKDFGVDKLLIPVATAMRFADVYEFSDDFHFTVQNISQTHVIPPDVQAHTWYPLKVGCLFSHSGKSRKHRLRVSSKIPSSQVVFFVNVLNNDDLKPVPELRNLWPLMENMFGYKVLVYMYAFTDLTRITGGTWTLELIFPRNIPPAHFCNCCDDTMCPCDQPPKAQHFPLRCTNREMRDFEYFSDVNESQAKSGPLGKYLVKIYEPVCLNMFFNCSSDLFEFEIKINQIQTRDTVRREVSSKRMAIIGLYLKPMPGNSPYHKTNDFNVTINCLRRIERCLERGRHNLNDGAVQLARQSNDQAYATMTSDTLSWSMKIAYDQGTHIEIEREDKHQDKHSTNI